MSSTTHEYCWRGFGLVGVVAWVSTLCRGTHQRFTPGRGNQVHLTWPIYFALTPTLDPYLHSVASSRKCAISAQRRPGRGFSIHRQRGMPTYSIGLYLTLWTSNTSSLYNGTSRSAHVMFPLYSPACSLPPRRLCLVLLRRPTIHSHRHRAIPPKPPCLPLTRGCLSPRS